MIDMEDKSIFAFRLIATMVDIVVKHNFHELDLSETDKTEIDYLFERFGDNIENSKYEGYIKKADSIVKKWNGSNNELSFCEEDERVVNDLFSRYAFLTACGQQPN